MYPNYNYFPQNQQPIRQQPPMQNQGILYLKGRPVSSIEEVKAIPIDFDGSIFIFPDIANKQIYTKQINLDGTASINVYELKILQQPTAQPQMIDYITRDEFNEQMEKIRAIFAGQETPQKTTPSIPSPHPIKIYDSREGKSPERRRMYMESKELHHDQAKKLKELEEYMQELNADILEMIEGASQEEKQLLQKKIALLATKINV